MRRGLGPALRLAPWGTCLALSAALAGASPGRRQVEASERARAALLLAGQDAALRAQAAQAESDRLAQERVAAAGRLRDIEAQASEASSRVAELASRSREAEAGLAARSAELAPLLPLAERLSLYPAETLLAVPLPLDDAVRGLIVLRGVARQIEADAAELRARRAEIAALQGQLGEAMQRLQAAQADQARQAAQLDLRIAASQARGRLAEDAGADATRQAALEAAKADGLRAAIARIAADQQAAEARARAEALARTPLRQDAEAAAAHARQAALTRVTGPGMAEPGPPAGPSGTTPASLTAPVAGSVVEAFGAPADGGPATGVAYQAAPSARVVSPCAGRVVFAAPFRTYGLLAIVDCGGGAHVVMSGFARLDAGVGQRVLPGEPVGLMPAWDPRSGAPRPLLKLELRRDGEPVNPTPLLRGRG